MGQIKLTNIRLYAYHGCLEEEKKIGSDYTVNLKINSDLGLPAKSDDLNDAVDYVTLYQIVEEEMAVRSKLLENVADRIVMRILKNMTTVQKVWIMVSKQNPPIGGNVREVSIIRKGRR
jgi:dihydroneopterin aldolase